VSRPKVLVVVGTRPEAIKLAPVAAELKRAGGVECVVTVTGQHRQLLAQALRAAGLRARFDLRLMRRRQSVAGFVARALPALERHMRRLGPDLVLVQGDTSSALCGALAAFAQGVPVGHVEAGLRTGDLGNPYPEEANRRLIDALSALLFAPTREARRRLGARPRGRVFVTGNTAVDALRAALARSRPVRDPRLRRLLERLSPDEDLVLATLHRRESLDGSLAAACRRLVDLLRRRPRARLAFPLHLNPRVRAVVRRELRHPRATLLEPLDYADLVAALRRARLVVTDSGGLQEEAATLGVPVLVARRITDRPEAVRAGLAAVIGKDARGLLRAAGRLLDAPYKRKRRSSDIFGDGRAGRRVASGVLWHLGLGAKPRDFIARRSS
jgi:UDP-N-acetylglucosamine 2-epimerase (non-hydrolysing)